MSFLATDCARARESFSVQLDGELPELALDRLQTHLRICPACTEWVEQVRSVTLRLREAPLEVPEERIALPCHSRRWTVNSAVAAAAAAAVVAIVVAPLGLQHGSVGARGDSDSSLRVDAAAHRVFVAHLLALNSPLASSAESSQSRGPVHPI